MKNKETLDFLKGTAMDGIINNAKAATTNTANANTVKKVEKVEAKTETAPGPSVSSDKKTEIKRSSTKKVAVKQTEVKADKEISTTVRINKSLLEQAMLIFGKGKKTREITEHVFLEFIKKNRKVLVQNIEEEIENLRSKI